MWNLVLFACLSAVSTSSDARLAVSGTPSSVDEGSDCPAEGWCESSACHVRKDKSECTDSCVYLADQCCTFCFTSSFGADARAQCISQCASTVQKELDKPMPPKGQYPDSTEKQVASKPSITKGTRPSTNRTRRPPETKMWPKSMQRQKVATAHAVVEKSQHLRSQHRSQQYQDHHRAVAAQPPPAAVVPPAQCQHCQMTPYADECQLQCAEMHEVCTTNCLVLYVDPSDRQPCLQHCISMVTVHSQNAFTKPRPGFDVIEATDIAPPKGPDLPKPPVPIPRSSPQAAKAANALKEAGQEVPKDLGLKLRHHTLNTRPTLTLTVL